MPSLLKNWVCELKFIFGCHGQTPPESQRGLSVVLTLAVGGGCTEMGVADLPKERVAEDWGGNRAYPIIVCCDSPIETDYRTVSPSSKRHSSSDFPAFAIGHLDKLVGFGVVGELHLSAVPEQFSGNALGDGSQ
jgi:hypothetical protein